MSEEKQNQKVLVVCSVGGHLTQAICALVEVNRDCVLVCNAPETQPERFAAVYVGKDTQYNPFIHFYNMILGCYVLVKINPIAIFSTGGPIALSFALLSRIFRVRFIYLDTMSRVEDLSNTGKLIWRLKLYDVFFTQWKPLSDKYNGVEYAGKVFNL